MKKNFRLKNLCCANCGAKMERLIQKIPGVEEAAIHFMAQKLTLECAEEDLPRIREAILAVIAKVEPDRRRVRNRTLLPLT